MPALLQHRHDLFLLLWRHPAKDRMCVDEFLIEVFLADIAHVHTALIVLKTGLAGDRGDRLDMIAGDDLDVHAFFSEIIQRLIDILAQDVTEHDRKQPLCFQSTFLVRQFVTLGQDQDPAPFLHLLFQLPWQRRQQTVRRPQHQTAITGKAHGAPLARRGERDLCVWFMCILRRKMTAERLIRLIIIIAVMQIGGPVFHIRLCMRSQIDHLFHRHLAGRDRTGLIQTERIDIGQRFQRIQILHQHLLLCQLCRTGGQAHADEQHQPFWQHAQQSGRTADDRIVKRIVTKQDRFQKQCDAQRDDQHRRHTGHLAHRVQQL